MKFASLRRLAGCLLAVLALSASVAAHAELRVGEPVPAFDTRLLDGSTLAFANLKQRPVLVAFWATWCPPCYREMMDLQQLYERYKGQGLEVIAISINSEREPVEEYLRRQGFTYPVAMGMSQHAAIFGPMLLPPRLFLIDRDGRLVLSHWGPIRYEALEATLKSML